LNGIFYFFLSFLSHKKIINPNEPRLIFNFGYDFFVFFSGSNLELFKIKNHNLGLRKNHNHE